MRILLVCMGNICRSPMAEGVLRRALEERGLLGEVELDSAGTGSWHVGEPPDPRAQAAIGERGIDISMLRGRQVRMSDFEQYDLIVAMDRDNVAELLDRAPPGTERKIRLYLDFAPEVPQQEVPDPYYGGREGFERVLDLLEKGAKGLVNHVEDQLRERG